MIVMKFRMSMAAILMVTVCPWTAAHAQIPAPIPSVGTQTAVKGDDPAQREDQPADLRAKRAEAEAELKAMSGTGSTAKDAPADLLKGQWIERKTWHTGFERQRDQKNVDD